MSNTLLYTTTSTRSKRYHVIMKTCRNYPFNSVADISRDTTPISQLIEAIHTFDSLRIGVGRGLALWPKLLARRALNSRRLDLLLKAAMTAVTMLIDKWAQAFTASEPFRRCLIEANDGPNIG